MSQAGGHQRPEFAMLSIRTASVRGCRNGSAEAGVARLNILLVEDDTSIGRAVKRGLDEAGHLCRWTVDAVAARDARETETYDVILLDRMLPGESGDRFLVELRQAGNVCPVILLTARGTVEDRVGGLEAGADDYLVKPFAMAELLARIQAVTRRTSQRPATTLSWAGLNLDLSSRRVQNGSRAIELTPTEFTLLELLMRHQGQVVTRKMMCEHVWGFEWDGPTNVIEVHVNRLRKKLDRERSESIIRTIRGRGYALAE